MVGIHCHSEPAHWIESSFCVLMASPDNNGVMVRSSGWSAGSLETPQ